MSKIFDIQILLIINTYVVLLLLIKPITGRWSCATNGTTLPLQPILNETAGVWFEVLRSPESNIPACAQITAPNNVDNNEYLLQVRYVNNINKGWQHTHDNLTLPWDNKTQSGLFELTYGEDGETLTVTFKLLEMNENYAIVCGTAPALSFVSLMKVLSRQRNISEADKIYLQEHLLNAYEVRPSQIGYVYQGEDCNSSSRYLGQCLIWTVLLHVFHNFVKKF